MKAVVVVLSLAIGLTAMGLVFFFANNVAGRNKARRQRGKDEP